jgi:hypothetical protein
MSTPNQADGLMIVSGSVVFRLGWSGILNPQFNVLYFLEGLYDKTK